jgi:nucleotide-binding universal stress UspA family protein
VLIRDVLTTLHDPETDQRTSRAAIDEADRYLDAEAQLLRAEGINVRTESITIFDVARGVDEAAEIFDADFIACATHGRRGIERLMRGSVAWNAIAHSPVPVLVRHPEDSLASGATWAERRILVPLDGSEFGDRALELAAELAAEWRARVYLVQVLADPYVQGGFMGSGMVPIDIRRDMHDVKDRLDKLASGFTTPIQTHAPCGKVVDELIEAADAWKITDIVMTSHGRTGLSRVIMGSVADALIQHLHCPIIVIPSLAIHGARLPAEAAASTRAER